MSRQYTKSHEWVEKDGDLYIIGITEHAQKQLGDLVFINLPNVGDEIGSGETLADVESVKAASDIMSPCTGTVAEINEDLSDAPELINQDPYGAWIVKLENVSETVELMDDESYQSYIEQEG